MASREIPRNNSNDIDELNKQIAQHREEILRLNNGDNPRSVHTDAQRMRRIADIQASHDKLVHRLKTLLMKQNFRQKRNNNEPVVAVTVVEMGLDPSLSHTRLKITTINLGRDSTTLIMVPPWFNNEGETEALRNIKYPANVSNKRSFNTLAQYRLIKKETNDFIRQPVQAQDKSTEIVILALDSFIQQYGGRISFTKDDLSFEGSADRAACGIADLGSTHMLANQYVSSAKFTLPLDLNYDDLAKSESTMQDFVLSFVDAMSKDLSCRNDNIRVTSVERSKKLTGKAEVSLVLTTTDRTKTDELADLLKVHCKVGFSQKTILRHVIRDDYMCKWVPVLSFLQLQPWDFDTQHNRDYKETGLPEKDDRGGYPYFLPLSWYRHALKVDRKYNDNPIWLGSTSNKGVWPVAFHGTKSQVVKSITEQGLLTGKVTTDAMLNEAIEQAGPSMNHPGLYVATHCEGGSYPAYTQRFTVDMLSNKIESFHVVFQCRVRPGSFTRHTSPVTKGEAWRIVDPTAIRPYGILLKTG